MWFQEIEVVHEDTTMRPLPETVLFAWASIDSPLWVWSVVMLSGFALLYSRDVPARVAGIGLCVSALLVTAGGFNGIGWLLLLILAAVFAAFRPGWLRRGGLRVP